MANASREHRRKHALPCEWCGVTFKGSRRDATTCSPVCRVYFWRWRKKWLDAFGTVVMHGPRGHIASQDSVDAAHRLRAPWLYHRDAK